MDASFDFEPRSSQNDAPVFASASIERLRRVLDRIIRGIEIFLASIFIVAVLLNFLNSVDRYMLDHSIVGADEVQMYIMVYITFIGAAVVAWRRCHLRIDLIILSFPTGIQKVLAVIEMILTAGLLGLLAYQSVRYASLMAAVDRRSDLASIPMWIPHSAIATGFILVCIVALFQLIELFATRKPPAPVGSTDPEGRS